MNLKFIICTFFCCFLFGCSDPRSEREKFRDHILCELAKQMKKKGLIAIGTGSGCTIDKKINDLSMTFEYRSILSLNHARELMVESIQTLLNLINSNLDNEQYFEHFPASPKIICISILSKLCPTDPECVEAVSIIKGNIHYDINHPIPSLGQPYLNLKKESFEEARKIVESETTLTYNDR